MGRLAARLALLAVLAAAGAVAAFATIAPTSEAELMLTRTAVVETLPIPEEALLPAPESYIREERFQRGDTLPEFLGRLGIAELHVGALARLRPLQGLRPGDYVTAEVSAEGDPLLAAGGFLPQAGSPVLSGGGSLADPFSLPALRAFQCPTGLL